MTKFLTVPGMEIIKSNELIKYIYFCASVLGDVTTLPRGTPLYGQPSWWGDGDADDENSFKQESKSSNKKHDSSISGRPY